MPPIQQIQSPGLGSWSPVALPRIDRPHRAPPRCPDASRAARANWKSSHRPDCCQAILVEWPPYGTTAPWRHATPRAHLGLLPRCKSCRGGMGVAGVRGRPRGGRAGRLEHGARMPVTHDRRIDWGSTFYLAWPVSLLPCSAPANIEPPQHTTALYYPSAISLCSLSAKPPPPFPLHSHT